MEEKVKELLSEEYDVLLKLNTNEVADHIYFNIIVSEEFEDLEDYILDDIKEWYEDYEFYIGEEEVDEEQLEELVGNVLEMIREYIGEE